MYMSPMLDLFLIRHGQTQWNAEKRIMGRLDIPLNETGQAQVARATQALSQKTFDHIYSSPQLRALETVAPLARIQQKPIEIEHRLCEMDFARWEGKVFDEIFEDPMYKERRQNLEMKPTFGVETVQEVLARTGSLVSDLGKMTGTIVCASHMDPLKAMVLHLKQLPVQDFFAFEIDNATPLHFVCEDGGWIQIS